MCCFLVLCIWIAAVNPSPNAPPFPRNMKWCIMASQWYCAFSSTVKHMQLYKARLLTNAKPRGGCLSARDDLPSLQTMCSSPSSLWNLPSIRKALGVSPSVQYFPSFLLLGSDLVNWHKKQAWASCLFEEACMCKKAQEHQLYHLRSELTLSTTCKSLG